MTAIPSPNEFGFLPVADETAPPQSVPGDGAIAPLNSLLRGEISAAETYGMAIEKCAESGNSPAGDVETLRHIQQEHGRACQMLRARIEALGGQPADSSGAWGTWAKAIEGAASLFGDTAAIKALKEGEEHGLKEYAAAIDVVDRATAALIETDWLPRQQRHLDQLTALLEASSRG